jgi:hypothetical protein
MDTCPLNLKEGIRLFHVLRAHSFASLYGGQPLYRDPCQRGELKPEVVWNIAEGLRLTQEDVREVGREGGRGGGRK